MISLLISCPCAYSIPPSPLSLRPLFLLPPPPFPSSLLSPQVVIVDEAHNLVDTITSVHSVEVTLSHLDCSHSQLSHYLGKFKRRLKPENLLAIKQIIFILKCLMKTLTAAARCEL